MNKKSLKNTLKKIQNLLGDDENVSEAIQLLNTKLDALELPESSNSVSEFPLPSEIKADGQHFAIFSDGACRGNPGPGSWGAMGQDDSGEVLFEASGMEIKTTNNIMELVGAAQAMENLLEFFNEQGLDRETCFVFLYSDSKYVVDGLNSWVSGWKKRGWKKADKKVPENVEIWKRLDSLREKFSHIHFKWVKAHAGHPQNERVDQLANIALDDAGF